MERNATIPLTAEAAQEFEMIPQLRADGIKYADAQCRKKYMGGVPFSLGVWDAVVKKKKVVSSGKMLSYDDIFC